MIRFLATLLLALPIGGMLIANPPAAAPTPAKAAPPIAADAGPGAGLPTYSHEVNGLKLPAPQKVDDPKANQFVSIIAETKGEKVKWIVLGSKSVNYQIFGKVIIVGTPAGASIRVFAYTTIDGEPSDPAMTTIVVAGTPAPEPPAPPGPGPGPGPGPNPPPVNPPGPAVPLAVVVVDDPLARAKFPYMADVLNDRPLRAALEKAGHKFVSLDVRDPAITALNLVKHIQDAGGAPALILMDAEGNVRLKVSCPKTGAEIVDAVNKAATSK